MRSASILCVLAIAPALGAQEKSPSVVTLKLHPAAVGQRQHPSAVKGGAWFKNSRSGWRGVGTDEICHRVLIIHIVGVNSDAVGSK